MSKVRDDRWSPEQVEGRIRAERPELAAGDSTTCRAVASGSLDCEPPGRRRMSRMLRHRGRRRRRRGTEERRGKTEVTHELSERPPEASRRSRPGDWEGDTVAGRRGAACLVTLVDRRSGCLAGGLAARKSAAEVTRVVESSLSGMPAETLTPGRGKEFARAADMQRDLGTPVFFCLPHHPWERGTNENANGLLRDFFPKGGSLDATTDEEVQAAYATLNRRPRKRLGWKCPEEVFHSRALHLL